MATSVCASVLLKAARPSTKTQKMPLFGECDMMVKLAELGVDSIEYERRLIEAFALQQGDVRNESIEEEGRLMDRAVF